MNTEGGLKLLDALNGNLSSPYHLDGNEYTAVIYPTDHGKLILVALTESHPYHYTKGHQADGEPNSQNVLSLASGSNYDDVRSMLEFNSDLNIRGILALKYQLNGELDSTKAADLRTKLRKPPTTTNELADLLLGHTPEQSQQPLYLTVKRSPSNVLIPGTLHI